MGNLTMKLFGSGLFGQAVTAAGVGAALILSVAAGHAQSGGPFAGFDGSWSGNGTGPLSNGTTEHIRCKADYKVTATGMGLKQNLHCASDSYKFDLEQRRHQPGRPHLRQLEREEPQHLRQSAGHRRRRPDRRVRRGFRLCRQPEPAHQRHQAGRADQLQGRDPRRHHHDDEGLIASHFPVRGSDLLGRLRVT